MVRQTLLRSPLLVGFVVANVLLAAVHLLPPSAEYFQLQRVFLALARSLQGPLEFISFSIAITNGSLGSVVMFLTISILAPAMALAIKALWRSANELRDVLPALLLMALAFGVSASHAGDLLVSPPVPCNLPPAQKVITYFERGWDPGAVYFLLEEDPATKAWRQLHWTRLDQPINNPCDVPDMVFPAVE